MVSPATKRECAPAQGAFSGMIIVPQNTTGTGMWRDAWYFGDELGLMLQLDALHMLG